MHDDFHPGARPPRSPSTRKCAGNEVWPSVLPWNDADPPPPRWMCAGGVWASTVANGCGLSSARRICACGPACARPICACAAPRVTAGEPARRRYVTACGWTWCARSTDVRGSRRTRCDRPLRAGRWERGVPPRDGTPSREIDQCAQALLPCRRHRVWAALAGTMGFAPGRLRGATLRRACCRAPYVGRPRRVRCVAPGYGALLTVRWRIGRSNVRRYESADDLERCSVCVAWKVEKQELTGTRRRCRTRAASASTILACCGELPPGREASSAQWDLRRDSVALV